MAKRNKSNAIEIDMTGVEAGGTSRVEDGDYTLEVQQAEKKNSSSGNPMIAWEFTVAKGEYEGAKIYHNTSLLPQALFNLKNLLLAMGVSVPNGKMKLDLDSYVGNLVGAEIMNEEYDGKKRPKVVDFYPTDDDDMEDDAEDDEEDEDEEDEEGDSDDGEDEEDEGEDDDEEGLTEEEINSMDLTALKAACKENGISFAKKSTEAGLRKKLIAHFSE